MNAVVAAPNGPLEAGLIGFDPASRPRLFPVCYLPTAGENRKMTRNNARGAGRTALSLHRRCTVIRPLLAAAVGLVLVQRGAIASTILPYFPWGAYQLSASPLTKNGTFPPDTAPSLFSATNSSYALGALDFMMTSRSATIGSWAGAKSIDNSAAEAVVIANAGIVAIPDEGELGGDPVTLYVHLVAHSYGSDVAYQLGPLASPLQVEVRVKPHASQPWQSFTGPGVMPIAAVISHKVELSLSVRAAAGEHVDGPFDSYAAIDLLLFLSYDTNPPPDLLPRAIVPGDATLDGEVDGADYTVWADHYLQSANRGALDGDFSNDGLVDGGDYTIWADHFSPAAPPSAGSIVPEPTTFLLAVLGSVVLFGSLRWHRLPRTCR